MGRRGPPPRTDKQLRGNPGHCRLNFPHPVTTPLDPPPIAEIPVPEFLTTGREVELFKTVVSDPAMRPLLRSTDAFALARWCTYQHFWELFEDGPTRKALEKMLRQLEHRLGLNPASRQRLLAGVVDQIGS